MDTPDLKPIYQSDTISAYLNPGDTEGPVQIVAFEGLGVIKKKSAREYFAAPLVPRMGLSVIHVVPRGDDWYQYPDMLDCLKATRPHLGPQTFAYGSSMGGYAVARFADALGVARGLALSPQFSIDRRVVPWERRWTPQSRRIPFLYDHDRPARRARVWVMTDMTWDLEAGHAKAIAAEGPTEIVNVPGAFHPAGPALLEARVLAPLVSGFVAGTEDVDDIRTQLADRLPATSYGLLEQAMQVRGRRRLAMFRRAVEARPTNAEALKRYARLCLHFEEFDEAQKALVLLGPRTPGHLKKEFVAACAAGGFVQSLF